MENLELGLPRTRRFRRLIGCLLVVATAPALGAAAREEPLQVIEQALAEAVAVPRQAQALVRLAWPSDGPGDPLVAALAREMLVDFGSYGIKALHEALFSVGPEHHADITATLIDGRRSERSGSPQGYLPALEDILWYGSIEARRLAMGEISLFVFPPAVLSTIDAIHDNPELTLHGIRALGRMRNERGRFFLGRTLDHSAPRYKRAAASSLVMLGDKGFQVLRNAARSQTQEVRQAATRALLPHTAVNDLTALYDYIDLHGATDDGELLDSIRERAAELEILLEEQQFSESASGQPEGAEPEP